MRALIWVLPIALSGAASAREVTPAGRFGSVLWASLTLRAPTEDKEEAILRYGKHAR